MYMQIINKPFDTHAFVKAFVFAKTDTDKAEMLADTIAEIKNEASIKVEEKFEQAKDELATKRDIKELELSTKRDIKELELNIKALETNMKRDITALEFSTKREIETLRMSAKNDLDIAIRDLTIKMYITVGGLGFFMATIMLGVLPFILKTK